MLEKIDLERLFKAAAHNGYTRSEIYAEYSVISRLVVQGRIEEVRLLTQTGLALRCFDGKSSRQFICNGLNPSSIFEWLGETNATGLCKEMQNPILESTDHFQNLKALAREIRSENESAKFHDISYQQRLTHFEVATSHGNIVGGSDESAGFESRWSVMQGVNSRIFHTSRHGANVDLFVKMLRNTASLKEAIRNSREGSVPWPAPQGEIPTLWSELAFGKLVAHFLRAFEADRVLRNASFLSSMDLNIKLPFAVNDNPSQSGSFDQEGSPRKKLTLFSEGRVKGLACNNKVAEQMEVPSTGHGRRQSFKTMPTIGLWNPNILPLREPENAPLLSKMSKGISVHDLEVLHFNPLTADIELRITCAYLIHHGEEGERIEVVDMKTNLLTLLNSLVEFSLDRQSVGILISKQNQSLVTDISTPQVISHAMPLPGQVPMSHYW
jgi:predicted Zn-dependent protease